MQQAVQCLMSRRFLKKTRERTTKRKVKPRMTSNHHLTTVKQNQTYRHTISIV